MISTQKNESFIQIKMRPNFTTKALCKELLNKVSGGIDDDLSNLNVMTINLIRLIILNGVIMLRLNKFHRCYDNQINQAQVEDFLKHIVRNTNLKLYVSMPHHYRKQLKLNEQFARTINYF